MNEKHLAIISNMFYHVSGQHVLKYVNDNLYNVNDIELIKKLLTEDGISNEELIKRSGAIMLLIAFKVQNLDEEALNVMISSRS
jgi:hypothetical protein